MAACLCTSLAALALILLHTEVAKAQCTDTFDLQDNYQGFGGLGFSNHRTVEDCQQKCLDTVDCIAFDFNRRKRPWRNMPCWIHQFPVGDLSPNNYVDHYMRVPCVIVNSTIALTTRLPSTTQAPVTEAVTTLPATTQPPVTEAQSNEPRYVTYGYSVVLPANNDFVSYDFIVMEPPEGITRSGKVLNWEFVVSPYTSWDYSLVMMLCRPEGKEYDCYSSTLAHDVESEGPDFAVPDDDTYVRPGDVIAFYQFGNDLYGLYYFDGAVSCGTTSFIPETSVAYGPKFSRDVMQEMVPCRIYALKLNIDTAVREPG